MTRGNRVYHHDERVSGEIEGEALIGQSFFSGNYISSAPKMSVLKAVK